MSEKDFKSVDIAVQISSSLETSTLYEIYCKRNWSFKQDMGGPLVKISEWAGRPICVAPLIHVIDGVRVLYVEATSALIDWDLIDEWIKSVTGKDDIKIENNPGNLPGQISNILWNRKTKDNPEVAA